MPKTTETSGVVTSKGLSLDTWAVVVALILAALVRFGIIQKVPW